MEKRDLTAVKLAGEIKVSHVTVGNWLRGADIRGDNLVALAKYFEVSSDFLLGGINFGGSEHSSSEEIQIVTPVREEATTYKVEAAPNLLAKLSDQMLELEKLTSSLKQTVDEVRKKYGERT